jgi:hypothetical protein
MYTHNADLYVTGYGLEERAPVRVLGGTFVFAIGSRAHTLFDLIVGGLGTSNV